MKNTVNQKTSLLVLLGLLGLLGGLLVLLKLNTVRLC